MVGLGDLLFPGIQYSQGVEALEMAGIAGDHLHSVRQCGWRDQGVLHRSGVWNLQSRSPAGDLGVNRQDALVEGFE